MAQVQLRGCEYLLSETPLEYLFTPEDFTDEHKQIAETTEQFTINELLPKTEQLEKLDYDLIQELMKKTGELGLLMIDCPEDFGGLELDKVTSMLAAEKMAPATSFSGTYLSHSGIGTLPLVYYGTTAQKERYLEGLMTGEVIGAYCLTEPGSGSDALGAKTTATLTADAQHYILNGTKQFITNAAFAGFFTIFAKIDKEHFTAFLVERDSEGLSIGSEEKKLGIKGSSTCQVILDNVKVPVENLLGEVGKGHRIAFNVLNIGRFKLGASTVGAAKYMLQEAARYANERKQFNVAIGRFGAIKEKLADMTADIFSAESLVYRLAGQLDDRLGNLDQGKEDYYTEYLKGIEDYAAECAISKVFCSEVLAFVTDEALQVFGGYGYVSEYPAERFYRDERINRIFEGTNEINRILVPGVLLNKGMKGVLPLQEAIKAANEALQVTDESSFGEPFGEEKRLLGNLRQLFLVLSGAAAQTFKDNIQSEQEVLLSLADLAIQLYAAESSVLRAVKAHAQASPAKQALYEEVARVCAYRANEKAATAAQKAAFYIAGDEQSSPLPGAVKRWTSFNATGLLKAKRTLAEAASENEKYIF